LKIGINTIILVTKRNAAINIGAKNNNSFLEYFTLFQKRKKVNPNIAITGNVAKLVGAHSPEKSRILLITKNSARFNSGVQLVKKGNHQKEDKVIETSEAIAS